MAYAINIRSDNESSSRIRDLWEKASVFEGKPSMRNLNYPPHITFATYDDISEEKLLETLNSVFHNYLAIEISYKGLGFFDAHPLILYAKPELSEELMLLHSEVHNYVGANLSRKNYRPGNWIPHSSLALDVSEDKRAEAIEFVNQNINEFTVKFDVADVASFLPVKVIEELSLRNDNGSRP